MLEWWRLVLWLDVAGVWSIIRNFFGYVVIPIVLRCNGFSLCYSRKMPKTELYNEMLREGRREEGKVRGEEEKGKVRGR